MPPERIHRARRYRGLRDAKGSRWHGKGFRDHGSMWINVNEGFTRGRDVPEHMRLDLFVDTLDEHPDAINPGGWCDVFFRKTSLFDLVEEHPDDLVEDWFDGGETVYRKYYDAEGYEINVVLGERKGTKPQPRRRGSLRQRLHTGDPGFTLMYNETQYRDFISPGFDDRYDQWQRRRGQLYGMLEPRYFEEPEPRVRPQVYSTPEPPYLEEPEPRVRQQVRQVVPPRDAGAEHEQRLRRARAVGRTREEAAVLEEALARRRWRRQREREQGR
ncbi:hypothetical protein JX265_011321 [Neoarthrinium moseri]|uniref:Uncharacterized protein n=1 Tax=Neoarthrinium moseri TaxID=1658444 RepID=A0A9P9WCL9_9PEZI|nr:hypothetical protein JX265_011321 [Neoarthrinium moseri]